MRPLVRALAVCSILAIGLQVAAFFGRFISNEIGIVVLGLTIVAAFVPLVWLPGDCIPPAIAGDRCAECGYPLGVAGHDYAHERWMQAR